MLFLLVSIPSYGSLPSPVGEGQILVKDATAETSKESSAAEEDHGIEEPSGAVSDDIAAAPSEWGAVSVTLAPERAIDAGARWSADGGATWRSSSERLIVPSGSLFVVFNNIVGWKTPDDIRLHTEKNATVTATGTYVPLTGSLRVDLLGPEEARWGIGGRGNHPSGVLREGIAPGEYTLSFSDIEGWAAPAEALVTVHAGEVSHFEAEYTRRTGAILVTIEGPEIARWSLGEEEGRESGMLRDELAPGEYTVSFSDVEGWESPENIVASVLPGETFTVVGRYIPKITGSQKTREEKAEPKRDGPATNTGELAQVQTAETAGTDTDQKTESKPDTESANKEKTPAPEDEEKSGEADGGDETVKTDDEADKESEEDTDIDNEEPPLRTGTGPGSGSDTATDADADPVNNIVPPEVVRPALSVPELTDEEIAEVLAAIASRARFLDLGGLHPRSIGVFIPDASGAAQAKSVDSTERGRIMDALSGLVAHDAEGNEADPFLLKTESFELNAGEEHDTSGRLLFVRATLTVTHAELASVDRRIPSRIDKAVASGKSLGEAVLDELRIFKWVGSGDGARLFDLAERASAAGFDPGLFFDIKAQDSAYSIVFHLLVFDGSTNNPFRLVQVLDEGRFIVFDGERDRKYTDPLILAAPKKIEPPSSSTKSGCRTVSGGTGMLLLLLPAATLFPRRKR